MQTNLVFDAFRVFEGDAQRIGDGVGHVVGTGRHDAHVGGFSVIEHNHVGAVAVDVDHRFGLRLVGVAEQAGQRERTGVDGGDHETRFFCGIRGFFQTAAQGGYENAMKLLAVLLVIHYRQRHEVKFGFLNGQWNHAFGLKWQG